MNASCRTVVSLAILTCGLMMGSRADADVIPANADTPDCDPIRCPAGSRQLSGGHGSCPVGCTPNQLECTTDAQCTAEGSSCVETRFCIARTNTQRLADVEVLRGAPDAEGNCGEGVATIKRRCTYPAAAASDDDGCSVADGSSGWLLALLALVALRRR